MCLAAPFALAAVESGGAYTNPVLAGDYPDPSIIRVGKDYWATATSSEWGPQFPILHSRDLVNWKIIGAVFPERPDWAVANFWAPEISEYRGRYYVYYVGRKRDGPLSVAVATANQPEGPYTDHGPLVSQEAGSIDPIAVTDEKGERYLRFATDNARRLHRAGVLLVAGTDAPYPGDYLGEGIHRELELLVEAGLSPLVRNASISSPDAIST